MSECVRPPRPPVWGVGFVSIMPALFARSLARKQERSNPAGARASVSVVVVVVHEPGEAKQMGTEEMPPGGGSGEGGGKVLYAGYGCLSGGRK